MVWVAWFSDIIHGRTGSFGLECIVRGLLFNLPTFIFNHNFFTSNFSLRIMLQENTRHDTQVNLH